jgi:hypothetical protein
VVPSFSVLRRLLRRWRGGGYAVAQLVEAPATRRNVVGLNPDMGFGIFHGLNSFGPHYDPGIDSASNRNEYQESFLGVKAADA